MGLREVLSAQLGEYISITVAPDAFTLEGRGSVSRVPAVIQTRETEGKLAAIGEGVPDAVVPVISLFEGPCPTTGDGTMSRTASFSAASTSCCSMMGSAIS